jgi:hypothetical protein
MRTVRKLPRLPRYPSTRFEFRGLEAFGARKLVKAGRLSDEIRPFVEFSHGPHDCRTRAFGLKTGGF